MARINRRNFLGSASALSVMGSALLAAGAARAQTPAPVTQDWANLRRYRARNEEVMNLPADLLRTVMMGDSITDMWPGLSGSFFADHDLVGRGIGGQTSAQLVLRFTPDVVRLKPSVVHLMVGTNDVAENLDPYDPAATTNNLMAMVSLAKGAGIKVVMASVPPATSFSWKPELGNRAEQIIALNGWMREMCRTQGHVYCDYWPVLANPEGGMKPELGLDSVHPNAAGYALMQPLTLAAIAQARGK
jgi:lysophospholipase L1-like esterase